MLSDSICISLPGHENKNVADITVFRKQLSKHPKLTTKPAIESELSSGVGAMHTS